MTGRIWTPSSPSRHAFRPSASRAGPSWLAESAKASYKPRSCVTRFRRLVIINKRLADLERHREGSANRLVQSMRDRGELPGPSTKRVASNQDENEAKKGEDDSSLPTTTVPQ